MLRADRYLVCYVITVTQLNRITAITELKGNQQQRERSDMITDPKNKAKQIYHVSCGLGPDKRLKILRTFQKELLFYIY
jgi:hypothetical protein